MVLSISSLVSRAEDFPFTPARPLAQWLRAARMLQTEAAHCEADGNLAMAYLYLYRHARLVLDRLPRHPDFSDPRYAAELKEARRAVGRNVRKLEEWKPIIVDAWEEEERKRKRKLEQARGNGERESVRLSEDGDGATALRASEHRALAVDLAHRELRRRDASRRSTRQAGLSPMTVASRRRGVVLGPSQPGEMIDDDNVERDRQSTITDDDYDDGVREVGRRLGQVAATAVVEGRGQSQATVDHRPSTASHAYHYPTVPAREERIDWSTARPDSLQLRRQSLPPRPDDLCVSPPQRPAKLPLDLPTVPPKSLLHPSLTSSPNASRYTFPPPTTTESGVPLRPLFLPPTLRLTFLTYASRNTALNLETCGILAGTQISNALFITHLLLPAQTSTSQTCDTTPSGDAALFAYCDSHSLLVLGWIHTHPTQTCFLSSRDLHTSAGYQVMLPEAIAIVCAPAREPEWGVFRLTDPPGLGEVLECRRPGDFHVHEGRNLYTDALEEPGSARGHVVEAKGLEFEVVDLRGEEG